jgi:hypothetical protein
VTLALATIAVLLAAAVALASIRGWRESAALARELREKGQELAARLEAVERAAGAASARAEVASHLLLEKGIADEDDLEAIRQLVEVAPADEADPSGTGQTVH